MSDRFSLYAKIPEPALRRLPWYLSYIKLLKKHGQTNVSSTQIAKKINVSATQIAKDLSYVDVSGKTRVGYDIDQLIEVLEDFLGFKKTHKAVLFGVGSLGAALLSDSGLEQYGLKILAGFDVNETIVNTTVHGIP
ncbi:MAG TPA: redox-sensing transcriptional repressor Rex, partial [Porphyromonadaceae bacterium]|nr:redox-sensing transcriptional repressor Rex [Porphyromonadaceae bacterium]